jgi:photosystem II stability/assembly factor-like uncharacterized protein
MRRIVSLRLGAGLAAAGLCAVLGAHGLDAQGFQQPAPELPPPINQSDDPLLKNFIWRGIGPANIGGRIDDIAAVESNPSIIYIGFATGGVWKSTNNGTTWEPIFEKYPVASIGDIAIAPSNPDVVYVGTGEPNNRQSSTFGAGVYKSTDGGKSFEYTGLKETQSIGRIVVHPKDPNIVYVAAVGHLFGPNPERGLYKSTDGGKTWTNTKFVDNDTGFTDVAMDPSNPNILYAASYQRRRVPWGFNGGGPGSGIWKTTDAGKTWTKLTGNGLPTNPIIGRIGLDIARSRPQTIYASIEVGASGGTGAGVNDDGTLQTPGEGRGGGGRGQQEEKPDPNKSGIWRSDDAGKTWRFLSNDMDRPMYYSQIRVDPTNPDIAYQGGAPFFKTEDGGKTWTRVQGLAHSDHHAIWIDPHNHDHLMVGNDGGLDVTYDQTKTWEFVNTMDVGLFYKVSYDMRKPYYVCGGLQDNGSWCGPNRTRRAQGIVNSDWYRVGGGDGFYTAQDPSDWSIMYSESQDGNTNRLDLKTGRTQSIRPRPPSRQGRGNQAGTENIPAAVLAQFGGGGTANGNVIPKPPEGTDFRFYWNTPFIISPHDPSTIYLGGDRLFKSIDRGNTWTMTQDLTRNVGRNDRPIMGVQGSAPMASKHDGAAAYSNIVTISESPVTKGVVWVGTNDGNLQVSRDGALTWTNVVSKVPGVPDETHVSRVEASHFDAGTAYVTFDNHRRDDHKPYLFVTHDFGQTWQSLAANLPEGNLNVITEDPVNRSLLFLGSEYALYVSLDAGKSWKPFMTGLPRVRIDDLVIQPREHDLIAGTHGRSIWILDDISPLEQMNDRVMTNPNGAYLFDVRPATAWINDIQEQIQIGGQKHFRGENPEAGASISYWLKSPAKDVTITISDLSGRELRSIEGTTDAGVNRVNWDLRATPPGRGRGGRGGQAGAQQPAAATPPANPPANPAAAGQPGRGRGAQPGAQAPAQPQPPQARGGGGRGRGRGGFGPALAPGAYLVTVTVDGKVIGEKSVSIEADSLEQ